MPNINTARYFYTYPQTGPRQWLPLYWSHCHQNKLHKQYFIIACRLRLGWSGFRFLARTIHFSLLQNVLSASGTPLASVQWIPAIPNPGVNSSVVNLTTDLHRMPKLRISEAIYLLASCAFMASINKTLLWFICMFLYALCVFIYIFFPFFLICMSYCILFIVAASCHSWYRIFTDI